MQKRCGRLGYKPEVGDAKTRGPLLTMRHAHISIFCPSEKHSPGRRGCGPLTDHHAEAHGAHNPLAERVLSKALPPQQPEDGAAILAFEEKELRSKGRSLDCAGSTGKRGGLDLPADDCPGVNSDMSVSEEH